MRVWRRRFGAGHRGRFGLGCADAAGFCEMVIGVAGSALQEKEHGVQAVDACGPVAADADVEAMGAALKGRSAFYRMISALYFKPLSQSKSVAWLRLISSLTKALTRRSARGLRTSGACCASATPAPARPRRRFHRRLRGNVELGRPLCSAV
ncbi:MAG: hypothetical protein ACLT98_06720 [Eggerthellaceae bacterium]